MTPRALWSPGPVTKKTRMPRLEPEATVIKKKQRKKIYWNDRKKAKNAICCQSQYKTQFFWVLSSGKRKNIRLPLGTEYNSIMIIIYYYHIYNIYAQHVKLVSHEYALRIADTQFLSRKEVLIPPQTSPAEGV